MSARTRESATNEQEILAVIRDGRLEEACLLIHRYFGDYVYGFFRGTMRDPVLADDLYQDWWMEVHKSLPNLEPREALLPWLYCIAHRRIGRYRRRYSRRNVGMDTGRAEQMGTPSSASPSARLQRREVADAVNGLSLTDRQALILRYERDLSVAEVAKVLREPVETIKKRIQRARARLKESLQE